MFEPDVPDGDPTSRLYCELCGNTTRAEVVGNWARFVAREPGQDDAIQAINRCKDRQACRRRVETTGAVWPVRDPGDTPTPAGQPAGVEREAQEIRAP